MLKIGMDDVVIEEVVELVEDYFDDWESVIEAIEDYSDEQKEAGIFDKGKTWLIITLIATLLGITTTEVMANPNKYVEQVAKVYQQEIKDVENIYATIVHRNFLGNMYLFVAFDKKIPNLETKKQLAEAKIKMQEGVE